MYKYISWHDNFDEDKDRYDVANMAYNAEREIWTLLPLQKYYMFYIGDFIHNYVRIEKQPESWYNYIKIYLQTKKTY